MRRPNGTGTVVKLSGKRRKPYAPRICTGRTLSKSGRVVPKYEYLGYFSTGKEAQEFLDRYNGTPEMADKVKLISKDLNPTFSEVYYEMIEYIKERGKNDSKSTFKSLQAAFNNLSGLHSLKFKNIDYELLQSEISKNKKLSKSSLNNIKNLLRKMYKLGMKKKYVSEDLSQLCDYDFTVTGGEIHSPFTKLEIQAIYNDAPSNDRDMVLILLYTGVRVQELLDLETQHVNLAQQYFVTGVKSDAGKGRIVPIHNDILPIIKAHYNPKNFYFWDMHGSKRIYQSLRWCFNRYMKANSLNHLPHDTRHTTATLMDACGVRDIHMKLILGHAIDDVTFRVYVHQKPRILVDAINKVRFLPRRLTLRPGCRTLVKL